MRGVQKWDDVARRLRTAKEKKLRAFLENSGQFTP